MEQENIYAAPATDSRTPAEGETQQLASQMQRLGTYIIDQVVVQVIAGIIGAAFGAVASLAGSSPPGIQVVAMALGVLASVSYYFVMELTLQRTVGKLVVGTRVVNLEGGRPTTGQVLGRSLIRMVPFEPFSFMSSTPIGWHDRWSETRVIRTR